eukprot:232558_1
MRSCFNICLYINGHNKGYRNQNTASGFGHILFCGWIVFNGSTQTTCTMNTALGCTNTLLCQRTISLKPFGSDYVRSIYHEKMYVYTIDCIGTSDSLRCCECSWK